MGKRLSEILRKNAEFEKETPYNFCDRWCERCVHEKQICCKIYLDEFERKVTCIAYGKDPDDPQVTEEIMRKQYEALETILPNAEEEIENDFENSGESEWDGLKPEIDLSKNNPLLKTAEQYCKKTDIFLKETFYGKDSSPKDFWPDFEILSWYHTLLPVKLSRALSGLSEPADEEDHALCDAVAQFQICKKAITQSVDALRRIYPKFLSFQVQLKEMLALLYNIQSRIEKIEEGI